jgi:hypothetical protein
MKDEVTALPQLIKALVHTVRGDLSVVSNEIDYLSSELQGSQVALARKRCASIADTLSLISVACADGEIEQVSLEEIATRFGFEAPACNKAIRCDRRKLQNVAMALKDLMGPWGGCFEGGCGERVALQLLLERCPAVQGVFLSCGAFSVRASGDKALLRGVFIDYLLSALGWSIRIECQASCGRITVNIPYDSIGGYEA